MKANPSETLNPYRIYLKATREWVDVTPEYYMDHTRYYDAFRKRHQAHGQCVCPRNKFWLCDGDCCNCEFHRGGDQLSLDYTTETEDGEITSPLDSLADQATSIESVISDREELRELFARLDELMPEARQIGSLRLQGLADEEIAKAVGINRTTFLYRLRKAKARLSAEYPDQF